VTGLQTEKEAKTAGGGSPASFARHACKTSFFGGKNFATNPLTILAGLGIHHALTLVTEL
jgi:hypothetical protein